MIEATWFHVVIFSLSLTLFILGTLYKVFKEYLVTREETLDEIKQATLLSWEDAAIAFESDYQAVRKKIDVLSNTLDRSIEVQNKILLLNSRTHELETTIIKLKKILTRKEKHV